MMTTGYISSITLWNAPRNGVGRLQTELATANKEISTGRYADIGATLGGGVVEAFGLRRQSAMLAALTQSNAAALHRLDTSQAALKEIQSSADTTLKEMASLPSDKRAAAVAESARSRLAALTAALNSSANGQAVFGGTNSGAPPLTTYDSVPTSAAKTAVQKAFTDYFQFAPGADAAASISASSLKSFIEGPLADLFTASNWAGTWSGASDRTIDSQISLTETVKTSASANGEPFRKLAMAYVVASGIGLSSFSSEAQGAATDKVMELLSQASGGLTTVQADLGRSQSRIADANDRMTKQTNLLTGQIHDLESVDPAEAKSRVDAITTQLQMSYGLTAQLRSLSLINFLS